MERIICILWKCILNSDRKISGRQLSSKNSRTARAYICSDYLRLEIDDDLGGNWRSILFAMSRAFLFAGMNDLREDDFFRLVFRMGGKFCSFELFSI